jgi:hypothetical protein
VTPVIYVTFDRLRKSRAARAAEPEKAPGVL